MGVDINFSNAFAADGIVPPPYGLRAVVEYRTQLFTLPKYDASPMFGNPRLEQAMDAISPHQTDASTAPRSSGGLLLLPDSGEREFALRKLSKEIEMEGMRLLDPRYLHVLRVDRPMFLGGRVRPMYVQQKVEQEEPESSGLGRLVNWFRPSPPRREPEGLLISWHWTDELLAIATGAYLDRIFAYNFRTERWETDGRRITNLNGIRCIAFRPCAGRVLAVGCKKGLFLIRGQEIEQLVLSGHTDVMSLDWSADGTKLASASATDGTVQLWDIGTGKSVYVDRGGIVRFGRGQGSRFLFVGNASSSCFRLWCCESWQCERWGSLSGPVTAMTWSPDGMMLLFSTEGESAIHVICIGGSSASDETRVVHTELTGLPREGPGGTPIILDMDDTGERFAVVYETPDDDLGENDDDVLDTDSHKRFAVALFATQLHPYFRISPVGYISGPENSGPAVAVKFKPRYGVQASSVLSCMWRNGNVTFTQLLFNPTRH